MNCCRETPALGADRDGEIPCSHAFFERGELLQEAEQNGIGPFEVMLFRHLAQFKKPPAAPVLSGEIDGPPALFKQFRRCLKDAEDIFFVLRIDLIVNSFRRNYQQVAGFAFKNTMHSLHPAGAPEKINEFTPPVAVRGNVACQPAPVSIEELWQLMIFSHVKKIAHPSALSSDFGDLSHFFIVSYQRWSCRGPSVLV